MNDSIHLLIMYSKYCEKQIMQSRRLRQMILLMLVILCIARISHSTVFEDSAPKFNQGLWMDENSILRALDFNGDGYADLLIDGISGAAGDRKEFYVLINQKENLYYSIRNSVNLTDKLFETAFVYAILPHANGGDPRDSIVAVSGDRMKVIRYAGKNNADVSDNFETFEYALKQTSGGQESPFFLPPRQIYIANAAGTDIGGAQSDLLVIAGNEKNETLLFVYINPFTSIANREVPLQPYQSILLTAVPEKLWTGYIDADEKADLFFEERGFWHIWLADINGDGFAPDNSEQSFSIPLPAGVKRAVDAGAGVQGYRWFVSVESEPDSDAAYVAFPDGRLNEPTVIEILHKRNVGKITRMFQFRNGEASETFPLFVIYDPLDDKNQSDKTFGIYQGKNNNRLDSEPLHAQFLQWFQPKYSTSDYHFLFDRPELIVDLDGDGFSDIVLRSKGVPLGNEDDRWEFPGFSGLQVSKIKKWSVYE